MSLSMGIVGLPNVGKSTLFNALTRKAVAAENYPFCTIDPAVGVVAVPDDRLTKLSEFSHSERTLPAAMEFVDIAGLVQGAAEGEGLGNQFLANIREVDAIAHVVRIFEDGNITHVSGGVDPQRDIEVINFELILADAQTVTKRLGSIEKEVKRGDKTAAKEKSVLEKFDTALAEGALAHTVELSDEEYEIAKGLHLLTLKPMLYVLNKQTGGKNFDETQDARYQSLIEFFKETGASWVVVDAHTEHDLSTMSAEERVEMREELGSGGGVDDFIRTSYEMLGLITFFTTGPEETRGWTIQRGSTAPEAGTAIHTDFRDKFIRADVISWKDLLDAGSHAAAREKGLIRTEGKEYIVQDGDVMEFRI